MKKLVLNKGIFEQSLKNKGNKLHLKEKHLNKVENLLKNKINELKKKQSQKTI